MSAIHAAARHVRIEARSLRRSPVFLIAAVLSLGLAMGAAAAAFSVLDAVRFRALPFHEGDRLVVLSEVASAPPSTPACRGVCDVSYETYANVLRTHTFQTLDVMAAYTSGGKVLDPGAGQIVVTGGVVSVTLFELLRVSPLVGRAFTPEDDRLGASPVTILSHALWTAHFGGDRAILGTEIRLSDTRYTVIGVMPPGFEFESESRFWLPVVPTLDPTTLPSIRSVVVIGRLAPGRTLGQLRSELSRLEPAAASNGVTQATMLTASALRERYAASTRSHDLILAGIVAIVLLIACANLANLVLLRTLGQQRELAVQAALGAGPARLIRKLATQNLLLVLLAAGLGLIVAPLLLRVLDSAAVLSSLRPSGMDYRIDLRAISFSSVLGLAAGALLSVAPARFVYGLDVQRVLRASTGGGGGGRRGSRAQRIFVVVQLAAASLLLTGAGLVAKTALRLGSADPGFEHQGLIQATPSLPHPWRVEETYVPLFRRILADLRRMPGVAAVALRASVPLDARGAAAELMVEPQPEPLPRELMPSAAFSVSADYFSTVGVPIVRGRAFSDHDRRDALPVAIINEWAAQRWWPGVDPVGRTLTMQAPSGESTILLVAGIARDNKAAVGNLLLADEGPEIYRPYDQAPSAFPAVLVRSAGAAGPVATEVREILVRHVPDRPVFTALVSDRIDAQLRGVRTNAVQILGFAAVGLLLAVIGIYGVLAYAVSRRTREIAVRAALGATPRSIRGMVLREAAGLTGTALAIGLTAAAASARVVRSTLHGTSPTDASVYVAVALVVAWLAFLTSFIPARRASRADPLSALKEI